MGSVKDLTIIKNPTPSAMGEGRFRFSDRYSVFDWGEMPDHIPGKGASLAMTSGYLFEQLKREGILTHYRGMDDGTGQFAYTHKLELPSTSMGIDLVNVVRPAVRKVGDRTVYDYAAFRAPGTANILIPLEVIYRNTLPKGSSVFRRLKDGSLSIQELGLTGTPEEGAVLPKTFFDVSTKLEPFDRYLTWQEAQEISGLSASELGDMQQMLSVGNAVITGNVSRAGLRNDDGKLEFALTPDRKLMVVDAVGTLDECRFTLPVDGAYIEVSKEIPRQWYRHKQPEWVTEIDDAKKRGGDWKPGVTLQPEPLPAQLVGMLSNVYRSATNAIVGRNVFSGVPPLAEIVREYGRFRELEMR